MLVSSTEADLWSPPGFGLEVLLRPRTCREPLAPLDLRTLSFLAARLCSAPSLFRAETSLAELGSAVYGRPAGGSDRRALEASLHRLEAAVVTLEGCDLVTGVLSPVTTRAPLFRAVSVSGTPARLSYEFSPWLAAAVAHGRLPLLDLEVLRALPATAARLWALLEGTDWLETGFEHRQALTLRCDDHLREALGLGHSRDADGRRAVRLAAAEVLAADARYSELAVKRTRAGWVLRADRAHGPAYDGWTCAASC